MVRKVAMDGRTVWREKGVSEERNKHGGGVGRGAVLVRVAIQPEAE